MSGEKDVGNGLSERAMEAATENENLNGTGGGAGGGTVAGSGDPTGPGVNAGITIPLQMPGIAGEDSKAVSEISALGSADGTLADLSGNGGSGGPTLGEAIGASAGSGDVGSGTPGDRGETGGGDPNR